LKIVYVEWLDSSGPSEGVWQSHEFVKSLVPCKIKSIGFVIKETKKYTIIAASRDDAVENGCLQGVICIPKCSITKIKEIERK
jgi:hypothetical protein